MSEAAVASLVEHEVPLFTPSRKAIHSRWVNDSTEPSGSREFRIRIKSPTTATSTQLPLWPDAVLLCQVMAVCSECVTHPPRRESWTFPRSRGTCHTLQTSLLRQSPYAMSARMLIAASNVAAIRARRARPTPPHRGSSTSIYAAGRSRHCPCAMAGNAHRLEFTRTSHGPSHATIKLCSLFSKA